MEDRITYGSESHDPPSYPLTEFKTGNRIPVAR